MCHNKIDEPVIEVTSKGFIKLLDMIEQLRKENKKLREELNE